MKRKIKEIVITELFQLSVFTYYIINNQLLDFCPFLQ